MHHVGRQSYPVLDRTAVPLGPTQATQTDTFTAHGGPVYVLADAASSSMGLTSCACWCLAVEVACLLNGASALVFWRAVVASTQTVSTSPTTTLVAGYHATLAGCFFHFVGCQMAVQLALRRAVSTARTDTRPPGVGSRTLQTSAWPAVLWYVLSLLPVVVPQFKLVHDVGDTRRLVVFPAFPVFVLALTLSVVLAACTLSFTWSTWAVGGLQRSVRHAALREKLR